MSIFKGSKGGGGKHRLGRQQVTGKTRRSSAGKKGYKGTHVKGGKSGGYKPGAGGDGGRWA